MTAIQWKWKRPVLLDSVFELRGGAAEEESSSAAASLETTPTLTKKKKSKKNKKRKKKSQKSNSSVASSQKSKQQELNNSKEDAKISKEERQQIETALRKDSAEALGDAIRRNAAQLRGSSSPLAGDEMTANLGMDPTVASIRWGLGASDQRLNPFLDRTSQGDKDGEEEGEEDAMGAGIQADTASVLVHYFMKSHGGAHAFQCVCSLLATIAGLGAMIASSSSSSTTPLNWMQITFLKRCMLFAMIKHVSGMMAASVITARAIPDVGLRKARAWMEQLATDPVSQYVFYAACILLWLPGSPASTPAIWWQRLRIVPTILVGPVVIRELISTALVISDVLVLWSYSSHSRNYKGNKNDNDEEDDEGDEKTVALVDTLLTLGQSVVNALMSLLVTPTVWRSAKAAQRQAILAKLASNISLALEAAVGALMVADAVIGSSQFLFAAGPSAAAAAEAAAASLAGGRPTLLHMVKRLICTRLYVEFLWSRRNKLETLVLAMRGGAAQFPLYVMDVLMDPQASMGISSQKSTSSEEEKQQQQQQQWTWREYLHVALSPDDEQPEK